MLKKKAKRQEEVKRQEEAKRQEEEEKRQEEEKRKREQLSWDECSRLDKELLDASAEGDIQKVQQLLDSGAFVNKKTGWQSITPLHWASENNNQEMVELLIDHDANVNAKDKFGETSLYYAIEANKPDMVELLLDRGANVNAKNKHGVTLLNLATYKNKSVIAKLLLDHGALVSQTDINRASLPQFSDKVLKDILIQKMQEQEKSPK